LQARYEAVVQDNKGMGDILTLLHNVSLPIG
jgi:hypothetical protein